jgi:hypothetical protein
MIELRELANPTPLMSWMVRRPVAALIAVAVRALREIDDVDGMHLLADLADQLLNDARAVLVHYAVARRAGVREQ